MTPVIQDFTLGRLRRDDRMSPRALNSKGGNGGGGGGHGGRLPVTQKPDERERGRGVTVGFGYNDHHQFYSNGSTLIYYNCN